MFFKSSALDGSFRRYLFCIVAYFSLGTNEFKGSTWTSLFSLESLFFDTRIDWKYPLFSSGWICIFKHDWST